jgi:NAD(P)-dependent dehydrogenase (short-subunit alcohol dehydrogenase family)
MNKSMNEHRRIALVTGAASGIGQSVAASLVAEGFHVGALDCTADGMPDGATPLIADVRDQQAVDKALNEFAAQYGRLDVLVNNAGVSFVGGIEVGSEEQWQDILNVNVLGQMRVLRSALPWLRKGEAPAVIAMSSCTATNGIPERALYSASKGAVHSMMLSVATDLVSEGIRMNTIAPATVDTPFMSELANRDADPAAKRLEFESREPTKRMVDPIEISNAVLFLSDPSNRSLTGTSLVVDGGMGTMRLTENTTAQSKDTL